MSRNDLVYFQEEDIIHLAIAPGREAASAEISPNVTAELNAKGEIIGVEILNASAFLRNAILDSAQARLLSASPRRIRTPRRRAPRPTHRMSAR